jgi:hypothetical protein
MIPHTVTLFFISKLKNKSLKKVSSVQKESSLYGGGKIAGELIIFNKIKFKLILLLNVL